MADDDLTERLAKAYGDPVMTSSPWLLACRDLLHEAMNRITENQEWVDWAVARIADIEAENAAIRKRLNLLADAVADHDHAELLKPAGISGWEPVDGWKMTEVPDD